MNSRNIPEEWLPQYTYADYEAWEGDWELIYGIPYAMGPSPKRTHQSTSKNFVLLLDEALRRQQDSCQCNVFFELDWIVNETTVVRPNVMIVCGEFTDDFLRFPPSLIIEVTSKRTQIADRNVKFRLYESNKVPFYIVADPDRQTIDVFALQNDCYQLTRQTFFQLQSGCKIELNLTKIWNQL